MRFFVDLAIFSAIGLLAILPLAKVSSIVRRKHNARKWQRAAVIVAFLGAGLGWSSRNLQNSCLQERNEGCIDIGGVGSQFLLVGGFAAFALLTAYLKYNDY